jgi:hypothetical protein
VRCVTDFKKENLSNATFALLELRNSFFLILIPKTSKSRSTSQIALAFMRNRKFTSESVIIRILPRTHTWVNFTQVKLLVKLVVK